MIGSAHTEAPPLLGRLAEQGAMTSLLDGVTTRGQALVLSGEPGGRQDAHAPVGHTGIVSPLEIGSCRPRFFSVDEDQR
jgi:hypothetical protein